MKIANLKELQLLQWIYKKYSVVTQVRIITKMVFEVISIVHSCHVCKPIWEAESSLELSCLSEPDNLIDSYAMVSIQLFQSGQHNFISSLNSLIKMSSSESRGQEAACACIFRPTQPQQWVIYMDGWSKFLKRCSSATITTIA